MTSSVPSSSPVLLGETNANPEWLLHASAVRQCAHAVYAAVERGESQHFTLNLGAFASVVERVAQVTAANYPDLSAIPYHSRFRHFDVGGVKRLARFEAQLAGVSAEERGRARFDLIITSVLLDAGAGPNWSFGEAGNDTRWGRSEGLAVASYVWFERGGFSDDRNQPYAAFAARLLRIKETELAAAFQVSAGNPLVGVSGRTDLLRHLGARVLSAPEFFGANAPRPGGLYDHFLRLASNGSLKASTVLEVVLAALGPVWPSRPAIGGRSLGDVWPHGKFGPIPLHKLSQWLTYSLCEALELSGVAVLDLNELTGLAEYRNGGLFVDGGVIAVKDPAALTRSHAVGSDLVIEWRALTVALLDRVADALRQRWNMNTSTLPLAKVLEAGTWAAGRQIAKELRPDASPPIQIESDGTVF